LLEVYTGSVGKISLTTYDRDGLPAQPDALPELSVYDAETGSTLLNDADPYLIDSDYPGEYEFVLSEQMTSYDRVLRIEWHYSVGGNHTLETEFIYVITPYATIDEIVKELGFSSRPEDYNYFSYDKVRSAERVARMIIDTELGFSIGKKYKTATFYGTGSDVLFLNESIVEIESLEENDQVVIDLGENLNTFGYPVEITETGYAIRIVKDPGSEVYEQEILDPAGFNLGRFKNGSKYDVYGLFGWNYVPVEIKQSVFLLVNDLLCSENIWRTKYLKKINSGQMSVEISSLAFTGTGNAIVDSLLQKFKSIQAVII
jgi:hypothetical protein